MTDIERMIKELISGCGNMSTDETIKAIEQHVIKARIEEKQERADELDNIEGCYYNAEIQREEITELKKGLDNEKEI